MIDYSKIYNTLTEEEAAMEAAYAQEYEDGFREYCELIKAYQTLINLEYDNERKLKLIDLLNWLHEDNK